MGGILDGIITQGVPNSEREEVLSVTQHFDSTVRIGSLMDGRETLCTGEISKIEGYETTQPGVLITAAAHCLQSNAGAMRTGQLLLILSLLMMM